MTHLPTITEIDTSGSEDQEDNDQQEKIPTVFVDLRGLKVRSLPPHSDHDEYRDEYGDEYPGGSLEYSGFKVFSFRQI